MDGRDDLRAAFEHRQAQEDRRAHEREALDNQRADFEREEDAVRQRLYEVADLTVQTLATSKPERILIMPKKPGLVGIFTSAQYTVGWKIDFYGIYVLCPDGTLIRPGEHTQFAGSFAPEYLTLHSKIDGELKNIRSDGGDSIRDFFREAFVQGDNQSRQVLASRLSEARESITERLAELLHERGLSV